MSANDNLSIKNSASAVVALRALDRSALSDGSLLAMRHLAEPVPLDYSTGGVYRMAAKSGVIAAGLSATSPIFSFRNPSASLLAVLHGLTLNVWTDSVGFAAGLITLSAHIARSYTAEDTGGTSLATTSPQGKLRTSMAAPTCEIRHASTGALTPGTRTLDTAPLDELMVAAATAADTLILSRAKLIDVLIQEHPMVLAEDEGIIIQATVPATGTWKFNITPHWTELPNTHFDRT